MKKPIRRTRMRQAVLDALYSGEGILWNAEWGYYAPGPRKLTQGALDAMELFTAEDMVGLTKDGWCVTTPQGTDLYDSWPRARPFSVEWYEGAEVRP